MKITLIILGVAGLVAVIFCGCAAVRAGYQTAPYQVVHTDGKFELRDYPELVLVETRSQGADNSFMRLFHYIGGQNASAQKISMTTPVFMAGENTNATMAFVLPAAMPLEHAPQPADQSVHLKKIPAGRFAVLRFSGGRSATHESAARERLQAWLKQQQLVATGGPVFGYFDPPWTPSFLRRNELMLRLTTAK